MSRKLLILSAVLFMALSGMAFAAVENIKVSGDINLEAVGRDLSFGAQNGNMDAESFLLSQVRLRFDADLTENVSGTVRLLNERTWGEEDTFGDNSEINLDLAYITMKEFLYQPLTVVAGRQLLRYGNALIVGDPDTNQVVATTANTNQRFGDLSLRKSFDAARVILDFSPWTIDGIYSKVREPNTFRRDNTDLWGVNANYQWGSFEGVSELYYFGAQNNRIAMTYNPLDVQVPENQDITNVVGGRLQFNPLEKMTLGLEGAYQFGDVSLTGSQLGSAPNRHLSAFAIEAMGEYRFMTKYNPKIGLTYVYLSGNDDTNDNWKGWDPMFEDQSLGEIINILFPNSNVQGVKVSGSVMPREDITLGVSYTWEKLASRIDGTTYSPTLTANYYNTNTYAIDDRETYLGSEVDAYALYDYTEDVQLKVSGGWFIPGDFFTDANDDVAYSIRGGVNLNF